MKEKKRKKKRKRKINQNYSFVSFDFNVDFKNIVSLDLDTRRNNVVDKKVLETFVNSIILSLNFLPVILDVLLFIVVIFISGNISVYIN